MKKLQRIFFIFLVLIAILAGLNVSKANTITLEQIAQKINSSELMFKIKNYKYGYFEVRKFDVSVEGNNLNFYIKTFDNTPNYLDSYEYKSTFTLEGNILKQTALDPFAYDFDIVVLNLIVNAIGQLHGYYDGQVYPTLTTAYSTLEYLNEYTLETEGIEMTDEVYTFNSKEHDASITGPLTLIDITKKLPIKYVPETYITAEEIIESVKTKNMNNIRRGNVIAVVSQNDLEAGHVYNNGFWIKGSVSEDEYTYKTFIEVLKAIDFSKYDITNDEVINYVKKNYPQRVTEGVIKFDGVKITEDLRSMEVTKNTTDYAYMVGIEDDTIFEDKENFVTGGAWSSLAVEFEFDKLAEAIKEERNPVVPPPEDEVLPPEDEVPPPEDEVPPPEDEVPPPEDEVPPPEDEVPPPEDEVLPPEDEVQPPEDEVPPPEDEEPPPENDLPYAGLANGKLKEILKIVICVCILICVGIFETQRKKLK